MRRGVGRAQTLVEVIVAIAILSVIVVMITADLTNITKADSAADRSIEISSANFLLGVMKADPGFWKGPNGGVDWDTGPDDSCYVALGPYTDSGPSPAPSWHSIPPPQPGCSFPYSDVGAPQQGEPNQGASPAPVGDEVQYMWNASEHNGDPNAADLTVWVRRDTGSPIYEYHAIRYTSPPAGTPSGPTPTPNPTRSGGGGGGGGNHSPGPSPSPTGIGV
ncbi:MAG TPA: prepilin-type N-terminal cleavage/methylation domain-containing protein [Candidatus Eremiobacteraceae bacterium]|nr:prepilin-type N-terminal cleavage/methylation domain-containing protein [Candidatus Eremiobacteraceae bacterium]